ncbi:MAG: DUF2335 domain-containing protein [Symploca sp. SIO2E6]|nr:DUF2335 domain-containing protein [Symploca sp. SIO2E6]
MLYCVNIAQVQSLLPCHMREEPEFLALEETESKVHDHLTGLLPNPEVLAQYNHLGADSAQRIIAIAEKEQEHRHKMQEKLVDARLMVMRQARNERKLWQVFAFSLAVVSVICGAITAMLREPIAGEIIGSVGVAGLVIVFVLCLREDKKYFQSPREE